MVNCRYEQVARYILDEKCTLRYAAKHFNVSKSTIHKDISIRLKKHNKELYEMVRKILDYNFNVKHIRGGEATRKKYVKKIMQKTHDIVNDSKQ